MSRRAVSLVLLLFLAPAPSLAGGEPAPSSAAPPRTLGVGNQSAIQDANLLHLTFSNFGVLGNNFTFRAASLEYPIGTGYEHLTHGGLWIGAQATDGGGSFTGVATAGFDQFVGIATPGLSEFTPVTAITRRSTLLASPWYSPFAVSHLDGLAWFNDQTGRTVSGTSEAHRPIGVEVRQELYAWATASLQDMVFVRIVVRALQPLAGVWLGMFTELASGPKSSYVNWPPSSGDPSGLGSWYSKKWVVYEDSLRLLREHYCAAQPVPSGCIASRVPHWIGVKLLTPPGSGQSRTVAAWNWGPSTPWHDQDVERYAIMSAGTASAFSNDTLGPQTGDPVELMAIGPFAALAPGDSAEIAFAFLGAPDEATLRDRARLAQMVHDAGYVNALTPANASLVSHRATGAGIELLWWSAEGAGIPCRVERAAAEGAWLELGAPEREGEDRLRYLDSKVLAGERYRYRLRWLSGETSDVAEVRVPELPRLALWAVGGHPSRSGDVRLAVTLRNAGEARLEVFDLSGRRIGARPIPGVAGEHALRPLESGALPPGILLVRLTQGRDVATLRLVILE